jgi:hypothetical protein
VFVHWQVCNGISFFFKALSNVQYGMMFNGGGDEMRLVWREQAQGPKKSEVIRFCCPAGEDDFRGMAPNPSGHIDPGLIHQLS